MAGRRINTARDERIRAQYMQGVRTDVLAKEYGLSRQRISQLVMGEDRDFKQTAVGRVVYTGLRRWMMENRCSFKRLAVRLGYAHSGSTNRMVANKARGRQDFCKTEIDKILAMTGMPYEEVFAVE